MGRQRPAKRQVAGAFSIRHEADEQCAVICLVWRQLAELVAPEPDRPPAAHFTRGQADDIGTFSRPRDELEIERPDFVERQLTY